MTKLQNKAVNAAKWVLGARDRMPHWARMGVDIARKLGETLPTKESGLLRGAMQTVTAVHAVAGIVSPRMNEDPMTAFVRRHGLARSPEMHLGPLIFGTPIRRRFDVATSAISEGMNVTCASHPDVGSFYWRHGKDTDPEDLAEWSPDCWQSAGASLEKIVELLWEVHEGRMRAGHSQRHGPVAMVIAPMPRVERAMYASAVPRLERLVARHRRFAARKIARAYMFHGAPGTGKTTCALAMADRLGTRLLRLEAVSGFTIGFNQLRASIGRLGPDFVLIDDVDKLHVDQRGFLLDMVEGMKESLPGVGLLFTSNVVDVFDVGMMRPGRIDTWVEFALPDAAERREVLSAYLCALAVELPTEDVDRLVAASDGLSHDYLRDLAQACLHADDLAEVEQGLSKMRRLVATKPPSQLRTNGPAPAGVPR